MNDKIMLRVYYTLAVICFVLSISAMISGDFTKYAIMSLFGITSLLKTDTIELKQQLEEK